LQAGLGLDLNLYGENGKLWSAVAKMDLYGQLHELGMI